MKKLLICGRLIKNPEIRTDNQGNNFVTFIVTTEHGKTFGVRKDCIEVSCNGKVAENVVKLAYKGCNIFAEGYPAVHSYINFKNEIITTQRLYAHTVDILIE